MAIDRRGFIQFLVGGAAGTVFTPIALKLTDDISIWTQNWPWIPSNPKGATEYTATVSKLCPTGTGLRVRTVAGLPIRVKGNPDHPLSQGKVSALAAAEAQLLYSPARLRQPLVKKGDGAHVAVSWDEALAILEEQLGAIKGGRNKLAVVSGDETGTINEVLSAVAKELGSSKYFIMPGEIQAAAEALTAMGGSGQVGYDVAGSDCVLALGADFLESWGPAIANRQAFAASKEHGEEADASYIYAGAVMTNTAVACGRENWIKVKPGSEAIFGLGVAAELFKAGAGGEGVEALKTLADKYSADKVARDTGATPADIKMAAKALMDASKPLVIAGSAFSQGVGAGTVMVGMALNMLLGNVNQPGGMSIIPEAEKAVAEAMDRSDILGNDLMAYLAQVESGKESPEALLVYEANPFYALPGAAKLKSAFDKIPFKAAFTCFFDETAAECDLVLPTAMGLERYDDVLTPYGCAQQVYSWAVPVAAPLFGAQEPGDVILKLAKGLGIDLGFGSFTEVLEAKAEALGSDADLEAGEAYVDETTEAAALAVNEAKLAKALGAEAPSGDLALAPVAKLNLGSRYVPTPPFNLKTIRDTELLGKEFFVQVNAGTAQSLGVAEGDLVEIASEAGAIDARIHIHCGVMDGVVAAPLGFGHSHTDDFTQGKGGNVADLMTPVTEPGTGSTTWTRTMVTIAKK